MALQDCIKKFKGGINAKQERALNDALASGMTDEQAVRAVQLMAHQNIVDIASRARDEGAVLAPVSNPVTDLAVFQAKKLDEIQDKQKAIELEIIKQADRSFDISLVMGRIKSIALEAASEITEASDYIVATDLSNDKTLMDTLLKLLWENRDEHKTLDRMGLKGKTQFELFDSFRALEQEHREVNEELMRLNGEMQRTEEMVQTVFHGTGPQTLYQDEIPKLRVLHNISADGLSKADGLGGLAVPSLAVGRHGDPFVGFGEITFIGTESLGDPESVPIFDADGYTVRFPMPVYKKALTPDRDALWSKIYPYAQKFDPKGLIGYHLDETLRDHPNPGEAIHRMLDSDAVRAWYLTEVHGENPEAYEVAVKPTYAWGQHPRLVEFFKNAPDLNLLNWEDPKRLQWLMDLGTLVEEVQRDFYTKKYDETEMTAEQKQEAVDRVISMFDMKESNGAISERDWSKLQDDVRKIGKVETDERRIGFALQQMLDKPGVDEHFKNWVSDKVTSIMGEPRIKVGGKWQEYNLENIVRSMKGKLKGTEFMDGTPTEGHMRALAAHRFKRMDEMRQRSQMTISSDAQALDALRNEVRNRMNDWTASLANNYINGNSRGYYDAYESGDAARRALVRWATTKGGLATAVDLEAALQREGFDGLDVDQLDEGMLVAMDWMAVPVPYFEAKPQRAVMLDEFAGAVIPSTASAETRAILMKSGVPFKEYQVGSGIDEKQSRQDATTEFTEQLNNQGDRTLFQSDIGFTSGLLTAAKVMPREQGTAQEMLGTLLKQPNVKKQEMDAIGLEEYIEGMSQFGYITRDQLVKFIENNGVQLKETWYQGDAFEYYSPDFNEFVSPAVWEEAFETEEDAAEAIANGYQIFDVTDRNRFGHDEVFRAHFDPDAGTAAVSTDESYIKDDGSIGTREKWLDVADVSARGARVTQLNLEIAVGDAINEYLEEKHRQPNTAGPAKWQQYTLPAPPVGPMAGMVKDVNHREIVLHVPEVGGYRYTMDDLEQTDYRAVSAPAESQGEIEEGDEKYWVIDARSPMSFDDPNGDRTKVDTYMLDKLSHPTIEAAKQHIVDTKTPGIPSGLNHTSHAFSEKNIIAWLRVTDREGPNGEKIFFVEETQSDLHQEGLTSGYRYTDEQKKRKASELNDVALQVEKMLWGLDEQFLGFYDASEAMMDFRKRQEETTSEVFHNPFDALSKKQRALMNKWALLNKEHGEMYGGTTPNMPWKGDAWAELAMKRVIRLAVEGGYDQVAWTTGSQQLQRYDISEFASEISWDPRDEMLTIYDQDGRLERTDHYAMEDLSGVIGAEPALELQKQADDARRRYDVVAIWTEDTIPEDGSVPPNTIVVDIEDSDIGPIEREWLKDGGEIFGLIDENGEMIRQSGGAFQAWEYVDGAEMGLEDFAFADQLPTINDLSITDEEGTGLTRRYDQLLVNVTNRALRKLDKSAKVKRLGLQMEGGRMGGYASSAEIDRKGGGNLVSGEVDPGAFYVKGYANPDNPVEKTQISPSFDTYDEAEVWHDNMFSGHGNTQHGFDITDQIRAAAMEGQTLFQDEGKRASITFQKEGGAIIRMTQAKDLSSFLHEGAHLYLEMLADLAEMPDATPAIIDDYTKALKYLGVNSRREITREHHELWARSFEAYLREGKAPTAELQPLFTTFKGWFQRVYRQITSLLNPGEELNDEIRGVFDRIVASEEQIKASEDFMGYVALYSTAEEMGVSQRVFDLYRTNMNEAHDEAVDRESKKMIKAMEWAQQQWWKDELGKISEQVRAEVEDEPVYKALYFLQRGKNPDGTKSHLAPFKLSKEDLISRYGKDFMKRLPGRGKYGVYSAKGGVDADVAASMFGFSSGNDLIQALIKAPSMEAYIKDESQRRMRERHPDPKDSTEMIDEATRAVHNEKRGRVLAAELSALRKQQREHAKAVAADRKDQAENERKAEQANRAQLPKREDYAHIKAAAKAVVESLRIRDVNPHKYLQAERKAGRLAFEAMRKKDYAEAYRQKRAQIMQYEAYRAAVRAKTQAARDQKYLKTFDKKAKRVRMAKAGVLEQIEEVLKGINLLNISNKKLDQIPINAELLPSLREMVNTGMLIVPESVLKSLETPAGVNWRELTVEEFAGIRDLVKQLEHLAKTQLEVIVNGEKATLKEYVDDVAESIREGSSVEVIPKGESSRRRSFKKSVKSGIGHWLRSSSIARILDNSGFGAVTRRIIVPIRRAYVEKLIPMQQKAAEDVAAIYKKHYSNKELSTLSKVIEDPNLPEEMSKSSILALALNWGSETNRAAVLDGLKADVNNTKSPAFTEQEVTLLLAKLDARDWAFVQDVWDYQDSYYPALAEVEKRRRGIAPERVEALPFTVRTSDGQEVSLRGGYHPLRYNREHGNSAAASEQEFQDYYNRMSHGSYVSASTRAGATYERTKKHGKVVLLSLNTIEHNLREITRDMAIGDEISMANRVLNSEEVTSAASNTGNFELLQELKLWLSDAAVGELPAQSTWEKGLSYVRVGFTKSKLAFNVYVTALQITGVFQSMAVIGTKSYMRGVGKFISNPAGNYKMVMEQSKFMEARYGVLQTWDKDVQDTNNFLSSMFGPAPTKFKSAVDAMGHYYFYPIAKAQSLVDVTTWMGAKEKGINEMGLSEEDAVLYADTQVEAAQTSGIFSDRSGLERGTIGTRTRQGQFVRLWTTLISYMLAKGNIAYEKGVAFKKKPSLKDAVYLATDYMMLFMVEGIASALLYGQWPGDEDEDESVAGWVATKTVDSMLSGIPLIREYSAAKYGSGNTPVGALVGDVWKFNVQAAQGEADEAAIKSGIKVTGTLLHLPASQTNRFIEALMADDAELYEYILGVDDDG